MSIFGRKKKQDKELEKESEEQLILDMERVAQEAREHMATMTIPTYAGHGSAYTTTILPSPKIEQNGAGLDLLLGHMYVDKTTCNFIIMRQDGCIFEDNGNMRLTKLSPLEDPNFEYIGSVKEILDSVSRSAFRKLLYGDKNEKK